MVIELKLNLLRKTETDRLIGQIQNYVQSNYDVIVILLGKTDIYHYERVRDFMLDLRARFFGPTLKLIQMGEFI